MIKDYDCSYNYNNLLDRVLHHRDTIISHLNWVCIFLGLLTTLNKFIYKHIYNLYIYNLLIFYDFIFKLKVFF